MIRLPLTAAALLVSAGAAAAQTAPVVDFTNLIPAEQLDDSAIFALDVEETEWGEETVYDAIGVDWTEAGEVEDLVIDPDGQTVGVIAEIDGGFLGIADRHVLLPIEDLRLVPEEMGGDDWAFATRHSQEALQELPEIDEAWWDD